MSQPKDDDRYVDGFSSLEGGMDSARVPSLIPANSAHLLTNFAIRGGHCHTRPPMHQLGGQFAAGNWNRTGQRFNGAGVYVDPAGISDSSVIVASGPEIHILNLVLGTEAQLPLPTGVTRANAYTWFCQVEKYMIMQNGYDYPLIYDGAKLLTSLDYDAVFPVPIGTIMAYGQGRLFTVTKDRRGIIAGDLIYGGHLVKINILSSTAEFDSLFTTDVNHRLSLGDTVTIADHVSVPEINGTYLISDVPAPNQFRIGVSIGTAGTDGTASSALPGDISDVLRTSENTYLAEGGIFQLPFWMGKINGLVFPPVEDTSTGQGSLLAAGEFGMASFHVEEARSTWKTIAFQDVVFREFGAVAPLSFSTVNGDFFFRSNSGIRNYRNSRLAFYSHGYQPISAELNVFLENEDLTMLSKVSSVEINNRLLMTCLPAQDNPENQQYFQGVVSLDFNAVSLNFGKTNSAYDGLWTGPQFLQLFTGRFGGKKKAYAFTQSRANSGELLTGIYQLGCANGFVDTRFTYDSHSLENPLQEIAVPIKGHLESKAFHFNAPLNLKSLIYGQLWLSGVRGETTIDIAFRADQCPVWWPWISFTVDSASCVYSAPPPNCPDTPVPIHSLAPGYFPNIRLPTPPEDCDINSGRPISMGHEFEIRITMEGCATIQKVILYALDGPESVGGECPFIARQTVSDCNVGFLDYSIP